MRRLTLLAAMAVWSCSGTAPGSDGGGGGTGGTGGGNGGAGPGFTLVTLDATARDAVSLAMAVDPVTERVGVVYFTNRGTFTGNPDGGQVADYDIKYVEYRQGVITPPQTIRFVQRREGLALTFAPGNGEPIVSYLGGPTNLGTSIFWFQNDAVINRRSGSVWTEQVVGVNSADIPCGNNVSDTGFLLGLWPALGWDSANNLVLAFRDAHQGEFPMQDWGGSDVKVVTQAAGGGLSHVCAKAGGKDKLGWGGHLKMAQTATQPAIAYDQMPQDAESGQNVVFQQRNADGSWGNAELPGAIGKTQTGPSIAWDAQEGFGIAVVDAQTNELGYFHKAPGRTTWPLDPVFGAGSGGWYPSLAMDPVNHEPAIAFYICSPATGLNETQCRTDTNELRVIQRIANVWQDQLVDAEGGYAPQLAFFASGMRVIAYRQPVAKSPVDGTAVPGAGILKLAVEHP